MTADDGPSAVVFLFPVPVFITFDELLVRPVRRLIAPDGSFTHVSRSDPTVTALFGTLPAADDPVPSDSLPVPITFDPDGVAVGPGRLALVTGPRRSALGDADLEPQRSGLRQSRRRDQGQESDGREQLQDAFEHRNLLTFCRLLRDRKFLFTGLEDSAGVGGVKGLSTEMLGILPRFAKAFMNRDR
jgi:hypothetical protein